MDRVKGRVISSCELSFSLKLEDITEIITKNNLAVFFKQMYMESQFLIFLHQH